MNRRQSDGGIFCLEMKTANYMPYFHFTVILVSAFQLNNV